MKKILALIMVFAFMLSFAGCNPTGTASTTSDTSKAATTSDASTASEAASQTESTTVTGTLKVATNAEFAPWESVDIQNNNELIGFDIDLIKAIGDKIGMKIEFSDMPFESVVASIPTSKCDIAISGLTINETRLNAVDFSNPYFDASQILIVKNDDTIFTGTTKEALDEQLKGKKVGVCTNFTGEAYANGDEDWGFTGIENAEVKSYANISLAITDLTNGNIDVIIMDNTVALKAVENNTSIKTINVALTTENYGIAIKKGNTELKEKIDNALQELKDEGYINSLIDKWINKD